MVNHPNRKQKRSIGWRVVYGETMPAWEKIFPTKREAEAFAKEHESFGDTIFSIGLAYDSDAPKSLMAAMTKGA